MRATGIIRRIDELGRIVIPKEIRRTLRIREGDPLEIYTDKQSEIILKKYSTIGELGDFAKQYADSISRTSGHIVLVADRDQIIATAGGRKELLGQNISKSLEEIMESRESYNSIKSKDGIKIVESGTVEDLPFFAQPIVCEGDVIGCVIISSKDKRNQMGEVEQKLSAVAAMFLGGQLES